MSNSRSRDNSKRKAPYGRRLRSAGGQTLVEFALGLPFILLILVAMLYFGRLFYVKQVVAMAAHEGARQICRIPGLADPSIRDTARGFTIAGQEFNRNSVIHSMLASGRILSQGTTGDLPPGSQVKILPWDGDGTQDDFVPPGTIGVRIVYPFVFAGDPFTGQSNFGTISIWTGEGGSPVSFLNFPISERAVVSQEVYQEVN
ncbi:MAG TPA: TadE/TadG family type IV pilus assembly protein [Candidatus Obscuribacterales bacterium]